MRQPLSLRAEDLGVVIRVTAWCVDTWCTRVTTSIESAPFPYSIAGARLLPWKLEGEAQIEFEPLPLVTVKASEGATELLFGALPSDATHATLVITRLQIDEAQRIEVRLPASFDPFDPTDPASDATGVSEALRAEDDDLTLAPEWECRGAWTYKLVVPPLEVEAGGRVWLPLLADVGPCALAVPWMDLGEHGTLLAVDLVPPAWTGWGALWKEAGLRDATVARVPWPRIVVDDGAAPWPAAPLGPFGRLATRLYVEGPPLDSYQRVRIAVDELHGLSLDPMVEHEFDAREFERAPTFDIPFGPLRLDGNMRLTIHDVYGDDACFILMYRCELVSADVRDAWFSEVTLVDGWDVEQVCQEDGVQPMRDLGLEALPGVRAMRFGAVRAERPLRLRVLAIDVALHAPITIASTTAGE